MNSIIYSSLHYVKFNLFWRQSIYYAICACWLEGKSHWVYYAITVETNQYYLDPSFTNAALYIASEERLTEQKKLDGVSPSSGGSMHCHVISLKYIYIYKIYTAETTVKLENNLGPLKKFFQHFNFKTTLSWNNYW